MTAPFAALEARSVAAVLRVLANTQALWQGSGTETPAIFDNGYALGAAGPFGMATTGPQLTCATAQIAADPVGLAVSVNGRNYLVAEHQPDGTGMSTLILELTT